MAAQTTNELSLSLRGLRAIPPVVFSLKKLRRFDFSGNKLKQIPSSIRELDQLKILILYDNPMLRTIPNEVLLLKKLEILDLSETMIHELPAELGVLKNLQILDLRRTQLRVLDPNLISVLDVEELKIDQDKFINFPPSNEANTIRYLKEYFKSIQSDIDDFLSIIEHVITLQLSFQFLADEGDMTGLK